MKRTLQIRDVVLCALFASLTAVCSQIAIPMPWGVPINFAGFSVLLAGVLLGPALGTISQTCYVLLGLVGLPVFTAFQGGIGVLIGPTGGYIIGYIGAVWLAGILGKRMGKKIWGRAGAMACGWSLCYLFGTIWFVILTGRNVGDALLLCVVPYLPGDVLKIVLAASLVPVLQRVMKRSLKTVS